jgi:hypothetical protein
MFDKRVIFTIGTALIISSLVGLFLTPPPSIEKHMKRLFINKVHTNNKYELITAGDSRVYRGISSKVLEEEMGISAFNLGFSSGIFEKKLFNLIDEKISQSSNKKIIILGITPHSLAKYPSPNGHISGIQNLKKEEVIEYQYLFNLTNLFNSTTPNSFWKNLTEKTPPPNYIQECFLEEGWVASDYLKRSPYSALSSYKKTFSKVKVDNNIVSDLYNKVKDWNQKGFEIYGFRPPSSPNMEELEQNRGGFKELDFVNGFINAGGKWISLDSNYTSYDGSHLTKESAQKLSHEIASKIESKNFISKTIKNKINANIYRPNTPEIHFEDNMEYRNKNIEISDIAFSGKKVGIMNETYKYFNPANINPKTILTRQIKSIISSAYIYYTDPSTEVGFVAEINRDGKSLIYKTLNSRYSCIPNKWCKIAFELKIPDDLKENDNIKVYLVNMKSKKVLIDNFVIDFHK